jgi:hypothetical protein
VAALAQDAIPNGDQLLLTIVPFIVTCYEALQSQLPGCAVTSEVLHQLRQPVLLLLGLAVLRACAAAAAARTAAAAGEQQFISNGSKAQPQAQALRQELDLLKLQQALLRQQNALIDQRLQQLQPAEQSDSQEQQGEQNISRAQQQQQQPMSADTCAALVNVYSRLLSEMISIGECAMTRSGLLDLLLFSALPS